MTGLNSAYKNNWRDELSQMPKVEIESQKSSRSIESDPIDFCMTPLIFCNEHLVLRFICRGENRTTQAGQHRLYENISYKNINAQCRYSAFEKECKMRCGDHAGIIWRRSRPQFYAYVTWRVREKNETDTSIQFPLSALLTFVLF
jgi:hypothetical protein